jgi:hypothetical protein
MCRFYSSIDFRNNWRNVSYEVVNGIDRARHYGFICAIPRPGYKPAEVLGFAPGKETEAVPNEASNTVNSASLVARTSIIAGEIDHHTTGNDWWKNHVKSPFKDRIILYKVDGLVLVMPNCAALAFANGSGLS